MGREVRMVPKDWEHPKRDNGSYQPQYKEYYGDALNEWIENHNLWLKGKHPDQKKYPDSTKDLKFWAEWNGDAPDVAYYRSVKFSDEEKTHLQMYEDTSEGTPISPVMETPEKLARWLYLNKASSFGSSTASYEAWLNTIKRGFAFCAVVQDGKIESGVEALNDGNEEEVNN